MFLKRNVTPSMRPKQKQSMRRSVRLVMRLSVRRNLNMVMESMELQLRPVVKCQSPLVNRFPRRYVSKCQCRCQHKRRDQKRDLFVRCQPMGVVVAENMENEKGYSQKVYYVLW